MSGPYVTVCVCGKVCVQAPAPPGWRCAWCNAGYEAPGRPVALWAADFGWIIVGADWAPAQYEQRALFAQSVE